MVLIQEIINKNKQLPVYIEKAEDGFYVVECPLFDGCYTQGKTLDEALKNIKQVINLVLKEEENREVLKNYQATEFSLHTIKI